MYSFDLKSESVRAINANYNHNIVIPRTSSLISQIMFQFSIKWDEYSRMGEVKFKGCSPQILLSPFLNTLT